VSLNSFSTSLDLLTCEFTLEHYFETIENYKDEGYQFIRLFEAPHLTRSDDKFVVMRHDVQLSLDAAYELAKEEANHNIESTYYVLLYSDLYNINSVNSIHSIRAISRLGHDVGLHLDTKKMINMQKEVKWLEMLLGIDVTSYSQHLVDESPPIDSATRMMNRSLMNADDWTEERGIKLLIENGMKWNEDCFCKHIGRFPRMQVATNPEWWVNNGNSIGKIMEGLTQERIKEFQEAKREWENRLFEIVEE